MKAQPYDDTDPRPGLLLDFAEGEEPTIPRAPFELEDTDPVELFTLPLADPPGAQREWLGVPTNPAVPGAKKGA